MLKLLVILGVVTYVLYKVGTFLFKLGAISQQVRNSQGSGKVNGQRRRDSKRKPKVGEYIDFEEVK